MNAPVVEVVTVDVLVFGRYRESVADGRVTVELPRDGTVADLVTSLHARFPGRFPPRPSVAVNRRLATNSHVIEPGDEVALIPAVAGG